jgi:endonuclease/exonuclease/phosphatase family metal-dependent hydrolase
MSDNNNSGKRKALKIVLLLIAALFSLVVAWFLIGRLTAPGRRLAIIELHGPKLHFSGKSKSNEIRIGTYNIAHGRGNTDTNWSGDGKKERDRRLLEISDFLRNENLDIIVLNEVDFNCTWSYGVNHARYIAARTGHKYRIEETNLDLSLPLLRIRCGNAILSRYPLDNSAVVDLPSYTMFEGLVIGKKRGVMATVRPEGREPFCVLALHLDDRSEKIRVESVEKIAPIISDCTSRGLPLVIAGDLNSGFPGFHRSFGSSYKDNAMAKLRAVGEFRFRPDGKPKKADMTYPAGKVNRTIDWIIPTTHFTFSEYKVIPVSYSDHYPVIAGLIRQ